MSKCPKCSEEIGLLKVEYMVRQWVIVALYSGKLVDNEECERGDWRRWPIRFVCPACYSELGGITTEAEAVEFLGGPKSIERLIEEAEQRGYAKGYNRAVQEC